MSWKVWQWICSFSLLTRSYKTGCQNFLWAKRIKLQVSMKGLVYFLFYLNTKEKENKLKRNKLAWQKNHKSNMPAHVVSGRFTPKRTPFHPVRPNLLLFRIIVDGDSSDMLLVTIFLLLLMKLCPVHGVRDWLRNLITRLENKLKLSGNGWNWSKCDSWDNKAVMQLQICL